jgi:hypothetical protein
MVTQYFTVQTKELIDNLKGVCTSYGLDKSLKCKFLLNKK